MVALLSLLDSIGRHKGWRAGTQLSPQLPRETRRPDFTQPSTTSSQSLSVSLLRIEAMPANFSPRKLFKSLRSMRVGNLEVQNDVHPPDGPSTPPVASEIPTCEAETLMAPELCITASLDEDNTKVASNSVTKPRDPPNPPVIINGQGNRAIPDAGTKSPLLPASAVQETLKASSSHVAHAQIPPSLVPVTNAQAGPAADDSRAKEPLPVTEFAVKETQAISTSQRLWNAAYDSLEKDDDTAKLVRSYMKILTKVLKDEKAPDPSALDDISADLKDPIRRQTYLQDLVKNGQKNIATTSKIAEGVDNVIEYIDKAKDMISVAIGNIPQAALPWVGVCLGLQVRFHSLHFLYLVCVLLTSV
jgi:hypothetical protein